MARSKTEEGRQKQDANLVMWERGKSGNPSGRPRSVLKRLEDQVGVSFNISLSKDDKYQILESLLEMSYADLGKIATDPECPVFIMSIAKGIERDIKNGKTYTVSELFDRFFGRAKQTQEVTGAGGSPLVPQTDYSNLTPEERLQLLKLVKKAQQ